MAFPVLLVCSGNICRSPIAEQLLRARVEAPVEFGSAGTLARPGMPMTDEAALMSRQHGGEPDGHLARRVTRELVQSSGLILTAAREHRARVVELFPRASAYTFTLRQFARLAAMAEVPEGDGRSVVAAVAARRGFAAPVAPDQDDVPDPYRRPLAEYEVAAALIDDAVRSVAPALARVR
ncbi:low molecular weight phosphatase family protein [Naasia aerilata]|uniref:Low molecular weight phosphatase family protein n=1 Tax=Naasia aerilata TaxID=1162966 RepID=A0ABM8G9T1_9MICO|nr:low molecular weight phosphatase family protein [Naasia aerilata]